MGAVADADNGCLENAADVNRACVLDMTLGTRTRQNGTHKGDRKAHPPTKPRKGFCVFREPRPRLLLSFADGMCAHRVGGASTYGLAPRTFPLGRPRPWMSAAVILQCRNPKRKRHHESYFENEKGGCARADSEGTLNEAIKRKKKRSEE